MCWKTPGAGFSQHIICCETITEGTTTFTPVRYTREGNVKASLVEQFSSLKLDSLSALKTI